MTAQRKFSPLSFVVGWMAGLLYLGALASLIPFGALLVSSGFKNIPAAMHQVPIAALALVGASFIVLLLYYRDLAHSLAALGWMTFLPGFGGLFMLFFSPDAMFAFLQKTFAGFSAVKPFLEAVQNTLPTVWLFIIGYILVGFIFLHIAGRLNEEHQLSSYFKKAFGPRVKIFRSH